MKLQFNRRVKLGQAVLPTLGTSYDLFMTPLIGITVQN